MEPNDISPYSCVSRSFSKFRTEHFFENVFDIKSEYDFFAAEKWSIKNNKRIFILGAGSNVLFPKRRVESVIVRNVSCPWFRWKDDQVAEVSSNYPVPRLLSLLVKEQRSAPYFLASVPASIGGAIAMNAGTGRRQSQFIGEYLLSVKVAVNQTIIELPKSELDLGFRRSVFSEGQSGFIVSGAFRFPRAAIEGNPYKDRLNWAKEHQDLHVPSCGSVFRECDARLLDRVRKWTKSDKAWISEKSPIWISNTSNNPKYIMRIIRVAQIYHVLSRRKIELEVRIVK